MAAHLALSERTLIVDAIDEAERGHAGELRVHIEERCPGPDVLARAKEIFGALGMHRTRFDTGVLGATSSW